jgi:hypothetical protein
VANGFADLQWFQAIETAQCRMSEDKNRGPEQLQDIHGLFRHRNGWRAAGLTISRSTFAGTGVYDHGTA